MSIIKITAKVRLFLGYELVRQIEMRFRDVPRIVTDCEQVYSRSERFSIDCTRIFVQMRGVKTRTHPKVRKAFCQRSSCAKRPGRLWKIFRFSSIAMESTGVYWKPVYNILELAGIPAMVVNASHMKAIPGRKTDIKDAEWIADLLRHGLLRGSFIPEKDQREYRELVRYRNSRTDGVAVGSTFLKKFHHFPL